MSASEINQNLDRENVLVLTGNDPAHSISALKSIALAAKRLQKTDRVQQSLYLLGLADLARGEIAQAQEVFQGCASINGPGGMRMTANENMALELGAMACCLEIQNKVSAANAAYKSQLIMISSQRAHRLITSAQFCFARAT